MQTGEQLHTLRVPKEASQRFEGLLMLTSVLGFLSMASIYLLFN